MSRNTIWIIGFLEVALVFLFVNSAVAKPLFKHTTSVLQELCSSFAAFALNSGPSLFNMADSTLSDYSVLSLLVVSLEVNDKEIARLNMGFTIYVWIRIVLAVVFTQFGYTIILVALAMLTHFSFDKNVWKRDIDSSPAPFPFAIIVSILLPCVFHRPDLTLLPFPSGPADASPVIRPPCNFPGTCGCPEKPVLHQVSSPSTTEDQISTLSTIPLNSDGITRVRRTSIADSETRLSNISKISRKSSITTSQSLVQVPNAAQRRLSFPLTLPMWSDEME
ncbi:hypothetical protein EV368DRAFT_82311 [Lentinula lateritia]|nr:hypothetical protein EV368DRAFT_82311 [Lentinula lateritia]